MSESIPPVPADLPTTLGALRESGWVSRPVKQEIREQAIAKIAAASRCSTACPATRTRSCRSSRTRCSRATT